MSCLLKTFVFRQPPGFTVQARAGQQSSRISLIIGSRGLQCIVNLQEIICFICFGGVRFDLGLLLQGRTRAGQHKSASISLIIIVPSQYNFFTPKPAKNICTTKCGRPLMDMQVFSQLLARDSLYHFFTGLQFLKSSTGTFDKRKDTSIMKKALKICKQFSTLVMNRGLSIHPLIIHVWLLNIEV